jgi:4,5-DOPA dioxygenase extradiol
MKRRKFVYSAATLSTGLALFKENMALNRLSMEKTMPVLFMGHGNPMNAISDNETTRNWYKITEKIPKPKAILCISAHWETKGTKVTAMHRPRLIYDMYGFPEALYKVKYDCPGHPELAGEMISDVNFTNVTPDLDWGLDHGAWSLLVKMYPEADIPCFQMSLNRTRDMKWHYELGKQLSFLRKKGVLIIGSGNIVHNLQMAQFGRSEPYEWALEFDQAVKEAIIDRNHEKLIDYDKMGKSALLSVNSAEHYIPMLYALALQDKEDGVVQFNERIDFGSGSMRCIKIG